MAIKPPNKKIVSAACIIALFLLLSAAVPALAQSPDALNMSAISGSFATASLGEIIARLLQVFFGLLGLVALAILLYAGLIWMTAGGDPNKVEKAKKMITGAVIGLVIIFSAFAIVSFIISNFGGDNQFSGGEGRCEVIGEEQPCVVGGVCAGMQVCGDNRRWGVCIKNDPDCRSLPEDGDPIIPVSFYTDPVITYISPAKDVKGDNPSYGWSGQVSDDDLANGAPGNYITISGRHFGSIVGTVIFRANTTSEEIAATLAPCINTWRNNQIVVEVPRGLTISDIGYGDINSTTTGNYQVLVRTAPIPAGTSTPAVPSKISNYRQFLVNNIVRPGICSMDPGSGVYPSTTTISGNNFPAAGDRSVLWSMRYRGTSGWLTESMTSTASLWLSDTRVLDIVPENKIGRAGVRVYNGQEFSNYYNFLMSRGQIDDPCGYDSSACNEDQDTCRMAGLECQFCQKSSSTLPNYDPNCDARKNCTCQSKESSSCNPGESRDCNVGGCAGKQTCSEKGVWEAVCVKTDPNCFAYLGQSTSTLSLFTWPFVARKNPYPGMSCRSEVWSDENSCNPNGCLSSNLFCNTLSNSDEWLELYNPTDDEVAVKEIINSSNKDARRGLIAEYSFGQNISVSGKDLVLDGAGNNDLTYNNLPVAAFDNSLGSYVANFPGDRNDINLKTEDLAALKPGGNFTISAWVKPTAIPSNQADGNRRANNQGSLVASTYKWGNSQPNRGWSLGDEFGADDHFYFSLYGVNGNGETVRLYVENNNFFKNNLGKWTHVVGIFSGDSIKLYVNGTGKSYKNAYGITSVAYDPGTGFRIGSRSDNVSQGLWKGGIDDVRIYDRAITDAEVKDIYLSKLSQLENQVNFSIKPKSFLVVSSSTVSGLKLNPSGGYLAVRNDKSRVVDYVDYGYGAQEVTGLSPMSFGRKSDGGDSDNLSDWKQFNTPTKGISNGETASGDHLVINEAALSSEACTCLPTALRCRPGQSRQGDCANYGQCRQIQTCQDSGSWGSCTLADPNCIPYSGQASSTISLYTWSFLASAVAPGDAFQVVVDCNRGNTCNDQDRLPSPTPWPGEWNTAKHSDLQIKNNLACVNSAISARFTMPVTKSTINANNIKLFKQSGGAWTPVSLSGKLDSFASYGEGGDDTFQISGLNLEAGGKYRVLISKDVLSETGNNLIANNAVLSSEACANTNESSMSSSLVAFCWNIEIRPSNDPCRVGCINCSPKNYFNRYFGQEKIHRSSPISEDNVCLMLNESNYSWEWSQQEQVVSYSIWGWAINHVKSTAFSWIQGASEDLDETYGGIYTQTAGTPIAGKATTTALRESGWMAYIDNLLDLFIEGKDFNFFKIVATEWSTKKYGACPAHNDFSSPVVIENQTCSRGESEEEMILQSPSPWKGQRDACTNAIVLALFNRNMKDDTLTKDKIVVQECGEDKGGEAKATSTDSAACSTINESWTFRVFNYSHPELTLEEIMLAEGKTDSINSEGVRIIPPKDFKFKSNTWYRVIIKGGYGGVRAATTTASGEEIFGGPLVTPTIPGDSYFSDRSEDDYFWYFKTGSQACPIDKVSVLPQRFFLKEVGSSRQYDADPQAANCNHLNPFSYSWHWSSLIDSADDKEVNNCDIKTGDNIATICDKDEVSCVRSEAVDYPIVKAFSKAEGQVQIKARAVGTRPAGQTCVQDKYGIGILQVGYGGFKIIKHKYTDCLNSDISFELSSKGINRSYRYGDVFESRIGDEKNIGLYECGKGDSNCAVSSANLVPSEKVKITVPADAGIATNPETISNKVVISPINGYVFSTTSYYRIIVKGGEKGIKSFAGSDLEGLNYSIRPNSGGEACDPSVYPWNPQGPESGKCGNDCKFKADANLCNGKYSQCDTKGLSNYFSFNDSLTNLINGAGASSSANPSFSEGRFGKALRGADGLQIKIANSVPPLGEGRSFSLSVWAKMDSECNDNVLAFRSASAVNGSGYTLRYVKNENNKCIASLRICGGACSEVKKVDYNSDLKDNKWHHLVATFSKKDSGVSIALFVDGKFVGENMVPADQAIFDDSGNELIIGNNGNNNKPFTGLLDELMIYDKALSEQEVFSLFQSSGYRGDILCNGYCQRIGNANKTEGGELPVCGNSKIEAGEQCDEGGNNGTSGRCSANCLLNGSTQARGGTCSNLYLEDGKEDSYSWSFKLSADAGVCQNSSIEANPCPNGIWRFKAAQNVSEYKVKMYIGADKDGGDSCFKNESIGFWSRIWQSLANAVKRFFGIKTVTAANFWCLISEKDFSDSLDKMRMGNYKDNLDIGGVGATEAIGYTDEDGKYVINYIPSANFSPNAEYLAVTEYLTSENIAGTSTAKVATYASDCLIKDVDVEVWPKGVSKKSDGFFCYSDPSSGKSDDCGRFSSDPYDDDMSASWTKEKDNNGYDLRADGSVGGEINYKPGNQHLYRYWATGDTKSGTGKWPLRASFTDKTYNINAKTRNEDFSGTSYQGDAWVTSGATPGKTILKITANDAKSSTTIDFSIVTYFCNNPWPDARNFPFLDNSNNCTSGSSDCYNTNFGTYYCRDAGIAKACAFGDAKGKACSSDSDCSQAGGASGSCQIYTDDDLPSIAQYNGASGRLERGIATGSTGSDCQNLPNNFVPAVGVLYEGSLYLWSTSGDVYSFSSDGWKRFDKAYWQQNGLPAGFRPIVGYAYGDKMELWNSSGVCKVFDGKSWTDCNKSKLPNGFVPKVGYYYKDSNPLQLRLIDAAGNYYARSTSGGNWESINGARPTYSGLGIEGLSGPFKPVAGYYDDGNVGGAKVKLWDSRGNCIWFNAAWAKCGETYMNGLGSFRPALGYHDGSRVQLWSGQRNFSYDSGAWLEKGMFDKSCDNKVKEFLFSRVGDLAAGSRFDFNASIFDQEKSNNIKDGDANDANDFDYFNDGGYEVNGSSAAISSVSSNHNANFIFKIDGSGIKPGKYYLLIETSNKTNDVSLASASADKLFEEKTGEETKSNCLVKNGNIYQNIRTYFDDSPVANSSVIASAPNDRQVTRLGQPITVTSAENHEIKVVWDNDCDGYLESQNEDRARVDSNLRIYRVSLVNLDAADTLDAVGIRVYANNNHYGVEKWYTNRFNLAFSGEKMLVDGYEGVRDGRTVYVSSGDLSTTTATGPSESRPQSIFTNVYLMSYSQGGSEALQNIFSQMVNNWFFNSGAQADGGLEYSDALGHCDGLEAGEDNCLNDIDCLKQGKSICSSYKAKLIRDTKRLADLQVIASKLLNFYSINRCSNDFSRTCKSSSDCYGGGTCGNYYPDLKAGTYISGKTFSVWPSWQDELGKALGFKLPEDPINKLIGCANPFDAKTCWDQEAKAMSCAIDPKSSVYAYASWANGKRYDVSARGEFSRNKALKWSPEWNRVDNLRYNPFLVYNNYLNSEVNSFCKGVSQLFGEICDTDGNPACKNLQESCGNGRRDGAEDCSNCLRDAGCGYGETCVVDGGVGDCKPLSNCGDKIKDTLEQCECGSSTLDKNGNGIADGREDGSCVKGGVDKANGDPGSGCSTSCQCWNDWDCSNGDPVAKCGNGNVDAAFGEQCDFYQSGINQGKPTCFQTGGDNCCNPVGSPNQCKYSPIKVSCAACNAVNYCPPGFIPSSSCAPNLSGQCEQNCVPSNPDVVWQDCYGSPTAIGEGACNLSTSCPSGRYVETPCGWIEGEGCKMSCRAASCGNGNRESGEACDCGVAPFSYVDAINAINFNPFNDPLGVVGCESVNTDNPTDRYNQSFAGQKFQFCKSDCSLGEENYSYCGDNIRQASSGELCDTNNANCNAACNGPSCAGGAMDPANSGNSWCPNDGTCNGPYSILASGLSTGPNWGETRTGSCSEDCRPCNDAEACCNGSCSFIIGNQRDVISGVNSYSCRDNDGNGAPDRNTCSGRDFMNVSGACQACPAGKVPNADRSDCVCANPGEQAGCPAGQVADGSCGCIACSPSLWTVGSWGACQCSNTRYRQVDCNVNQSICDVCSASRPADNGTCNHVNDGRCVSGGCEGFYNESACPVVVGDRITLKSGGEFIHKDGNNVITADNGTSKISIYIEAGGGGSNLYALRYWTGSPQGYLYHEGGGMKIGSPRPDKFTGYYIGSSNLYKGQSYCISFVWDPDIGDPYARYIDPDIDGENKQIGEGSSCTNFTVCDEAGSCSF